ncbi:MAG: hypothetical protein JO115_12900 [Pseudonocardiales bacterium]|nr:hypothetical protein [Pseudonocardiales bacterium]
MTASGATLSTSDRQRIVGARARRGVLASPRARVPALREHDAASISDNEGIVRVPASLVPALKAALA